MNVKDFEALMAIVSGCKKQELQEIWRIIDSEMDRRTACEDVEEYSARLRARLTSEETPTK